MASGISPFEIASIVAEQTMAIEYVVASVEAIAEVAAEVAVEATAEVTAEVAAEDTVEELCASGGATKYEYEPGQRDKRR